MEVQLVQRTKNGTLVSINDKEAVYDINIVFSIAIKQLKLYFEFWCQQSYSPQHSTSNISLSMKKDVMTYSRYIFF